MVKRCKISRMAPPSRQKLDAMLASGATIDETHQAAQELGEDISRSSIGRRAKLIAHEGKLMREMRMMCGALMGQMEGEGLTPEDSVRFLGSMLTVRLQQHLLQPAEFPLDTDTISEMARAVRTLGKVFKENPADRREHSATADPTVLEMLETVRRYSLEGREEKEGQHEDQN